MFLCRGLRHELRARLPLYWDDWREGLTNKKVLSSTLHVYFVSVFPAITFGAYIDKATGGSMGVVEVLLADALCGVMAALLFGQPLVIVGVTGPVSIFCATLYAICVSLQLDYLGMIFWVAFWAALMHFVLAAVNACSLIRVVTRFSEEVFAILIAVVFIVNACVEFADEFATRPLDAALLALLLGLATFVVAMALFGARSWVLFNKAVRGLIADYGPSLAIIVFTGAQFLPRLSTADLARLSVPQTFQPTAARPWLVPFWQVPVWGVFAAIIPAFILTVLFFFDHNISASLSQKPEFHLRKPSAYNWDFFVLGLTVLATGFLGLPPTNGLIPQAPIHVRSLAKIREVSHGRSKREIWVKVCENRVSPFGQSALIGLTLAPPFLFLMSWIPSSVLAGVFLFMGFTSLPGNQLYARTMLMFTDRHLIDHQVPYENVPPRVSVGFTVIQLVMVGAILGITYTPAGIVFPVLIALLVPLRRYVLVRIFSAENLHKLDGGEDDNAAGTGELVNATVATLELVATSGADGAATAAAEAAAPAADTRKPQPEDVSLSDSNGDDDVQQQQ